MRLLLKHQAATEDYSNEGLTPVGVAARYGHREVVQVLCDHGVDVSASPFQKTALDESLLRQDFKTADLLIDKGALTVKPNRPNHVDETWSGVVQHRNVPALRFLLAKGLDVNKPCVPPPPGSRNRSYITALAWTRHQVGVIQKRCDHLVGQINGTNPNKATLQSTLDYEKKNLAVAKEAEQVLLDAGAKE